MNSKYLKVVFWYHLIRCCFYHRFTTTSTETTPHSETEQATDRDLDYYDDQRDASDFPGEPGISRNRQGTFPLSKRNEVSSKLQVPRSPQPFRRRYTLATSGANLGASSSSLPNGRTVSHRASTRSAGETYSDDETIVSRAARRNELAGGSFSRHRNAESPSRSQTPTRHFSSSSSASESMSDSHIRGVGKLNIILDFTCHTSKLSVTISKIDFPPYQQRDQQLLEVSVMLLPGKRQSFRARPKEFNEPVAIYLYPRDKVKDMSLRFRLYEHGSMGARHLLGEGVLRLRNINLDTEMVPVSVDLQPPGSYVPEGASGAIMYEGELAISEEDRPEILISLEYRRLTGKLLLEVIKTRNLGMLTDSKAKEMFVSVRLIGSNGELISKGRTTPRRHMVDPEYNEMFLFHVPEQELNSVTVLITVTSVSKTLGRKLKIGQLALGQNFSSEEELKHWYEMTRSKEKSIVRWHRINEIT